MTQSGAYRALTSTSPLIEMSGEVAIFSSTIGSGWQFGATGLGLNQFLGGLDIDPTSEAIRAITARFPVIRTFSKAGAFGATAWHQFPFLFNLASQSYTISLDGTMLGSAYAFCGNNAGCNTANVSQYGKGVFGSLGRASANDSAHFG